MDAVPAFAKWKLCDHYRPKAGRGETKLAGRENHEEPVNIFWIDLTYCKLQ
jgi:hypothetical protein